MNIKNTSNNIKCISCCYVKADKSASTNQWVAYECGNFESEYHRCLLNVSPNGDMQFRITWAGCPLGKRRTSR